MQRQKSLPFSFNRRRVVIIIAACLLIAAIFGLFMVMQPLRTIENFCQAAKEEKSSFKGGVGYDKLLVSFKKLDVVAPKDIHSDTSLIVKGYESIVSDPSKAVSAEFGIAGSQMRVGDYITKNCPNY